MELEWYFYKKGFNPKPYLDTSPLISMEVISLCNCFFIVMQTQSFGIWNFQSLSINLDSCSNSKSEGTKIYAPSLEDKFYIHVIEPTIAV